MSKENFDIVSSRRMQAGWALNEDLFAVFAFVCRITPSFLVVSVIVESSGSSVFQRRGEHFKGRGYPLRLSAGLII